MARKAYTGVATPRLFDELPTLRQKAVVHSILAGSSIPSALLRATATGPVAAANALRRYHHGEQYFYDPTVVTSSLNTLAGEEVWLQFLTATYSPGVGEFFVIDATDVQPVGVNGLQTYHGDFALQENPIIAPDVFSRFEYLTGGDINIYKNDAVPTESLHQLVSNPVLTDIEHYVRASWYEDVGGSPSLKQTITQIYNESAGNLPALHDTTDFEPVQLDREVYPLTPLRVNGVDYNPEYDITGVGLEGSNSIKNSCAYMGIDAEQILGNILENPEEGIIDDVYLGFGISVTSDEEWAIAGLAATFSLLNSLNPGTFDMFTDTSIRQNITVRAPQEGGISMILAYNYITVTEVMGTASYSKSFSEGTSIEACFPAPNPADEPNCTLNGSTNSFTFIRPIWDWEGEQSYYEEIVVSGLTLLHSVDVPTFGVKVTQLTGNEDELKIPLLVSVTSLVPKRLRDDLIYGSLSLYIYSIEIVKLKWYETGVFKALLVIATVVLAVYTAGLSLSLSFTTLAGAAAAITAIAEVMIVMALQNLAAAWLVEELGFLGTVLAVYLIIATGNVDAALLTSTKGAAALLSAVTRVHTMYTDNNYEQLMEEQAGFEVLAEERKLLLDAAEEALDYGTTFDLLDAINERSLPNVQAGESPTEFYARTSSTPDLPAINASLVTNFHEAKLALPMVDSQIPQNDFN